MPDDPPKSGNIINWVIMALMTAQTGLLSWTLRTISIYQKESSAERQQLLDYTLKAAINSGEARNLARSTMTAVDSTNERIEAVQDTTEKTRSVVGAVQKTVGEVKKVVESQEQP